MSAERKLLGWRVRIDDGGAPLYEGKEGGPSEVSDRRKARMFKSTADAERVARVLENGRIIPVYARAKPRMSDQDFWDMAAVDTLRALAPLAYSVESKAHDAALFADTLLAERKKRFEKGGVV